jgi:hypothetical protein
MTTAPDPRRANGGAERGDHVELLLIRHEETAGQDAQPQVSGPVQDLIPAAPALLDPATPCARPEAAPGNFTDCYARELPGLIWFVMSLGANAEVAAVRKVRPAPWHDVRRAPWDVAKPAPQHEVILTGMVNEAAPAGMVDE